MGTGEKPAVAQDTSQTPTMSDDGSINRTNTEKTNIKCDVKPLRPGYWRLCTENANFRWFLVSYVVTQLGEWLTYVASMSLLKQGQGTRGNILISCLVVARLVPITISSFVGGVLADTKDRRKIMLVLDVLGAGVALCYLQSSITAIYVCSIAQSTISGLYQPSRSSILPLLVSSEYVEKANELTTILWSLSAALGACIGGFVVDHFGTSFCFATDSAFYLLSASILAVKVKGDYCVHTKVLKESGWLIREVNAFLTTNEAAPFLLIKVCGAFLFGASDVVNVTFSQVDGTLSSQRLGWMFASVGAGCLLGPLLMPEGRSYTKTCVGSYFALGLGYGFIGLSQAFWSKCAWTILRAAGSAVLWVDSTILLQNATPSTLLGRISCVDFALATLGESVSAVVAGLLQDGGMSADEVAYILSGMAFLLTAAWSVFLMSRNVRPSNETPTLIELEPLQQDSNVA